MLDLTGKKYGRLLVIKEVERVGNNRRWLCKCECGTKTIVYQSNLRRGHTKSCGCLVDDFSQYAKEAFVEDLTGRTFGHLTVLNRQDKHRVAWLCQCSCGEKTIVTADNLQNGHTTSCGCKRIATINKTRKKTDEEMRIDNVLVHTLTRKPSVLNTTGVKGVSVTRSRNGAIKYRASITVKRKRISLGTFDTLEEAAKARSEAEKKHHLPYIQKLEERQNETEK